MRILLVSLTLLLAGCSTLFSSSSSSTGEAFDNIAQMFDGSSAAGQGPTYGRSGPIPYKAMWDGYQARDGDYTGRDLTRITLHELNFLPDEFYAFVPKDIRRWCPGFRRQGLEGRKAFYLGLISGIARFETDFRAHVKYLEAGGHYSRGILQLGQLALSYYPEGRCDASGDPRQLHDLRENISCGVMLVNHWVEKDGYIASSGNVGDGDARFYGSARYWSTLRDYRKSYSEIQRFTRSLPVCS